MTASTTALLLTVCALVVATPAAAAPRTDRALALAADVWAPGCELTLDWAPLPSDVDVSAAGWAQLGSCHITLNSDHVWLGEPELCHVVLHEAGHAVGVEHSANPQSIMFPTFNPRRGTTTGRHGRRHDAWGGIDRRCLPAPVAGVSRARRHQILRGRVAA